MPDQGCVGLPDIGLRDDGRVRRAILAAVVTGAALLAPATTTAATIARSRRALTQGTITVSTPGARAVITRDPFHLVIERRGGDPTLSEVANRGGHPLHLASTLDPRGPGIPNPVARTPVAPLSFLVGTDTLEQYAGGLWGGDLKSGTAQGTWYSARRVLSARRDGRGMRLVLSTDDPAGRRLVVTVAPQARDAIHLNARPTPSAGVAEVGDSFQSDAGEGFFGFGGRHNGLDQHGQALDSWTSEENLHAPELSGRLYPNGSTAAYYPVPEFVSSHPYGFLLDQYQLARFALDVDGRRTWDVTVAAPSLSYTVATGQAARTIATLTRISGRQPAPAQWALGPMLDRLVKNVGETQADYQTDVRADLLNIRRYHLPLTAYRLEGWGLPGATPGLPTPSDNDGLDLITYISASLQSQAFRQLQARHIHPLVYLRPWLTPGSAPVRAGLEVRTASGAPYYMTSTSGAPIALLDFTNPAAVRFWQREVAAALNLGADGFMQDFGEQVLLGMHFHDGQTGATMHNEYPVLAVKATRGEFTRYARSHPGADPFVFTRAGYTGSARYENANFPGDETTDWSHSSGLRSLTSDMLNRAVDGAYGYGTDIGGYFDITTPPTTRQLFLRWAEWAALSPVFRLHGSGLAGTHTPWSFGAATVRTYDKISRLHLRAAPLIERLWHHADVTGMPVTRPLWLQFPTDRATWNQDQEWMLGPDVLVAPVVTKGAISRSVYFPPGCWRAPSGATHHGPGSARLSAPLTVLPYFTRCGSAPFRRQP
jgi:alpha-glucosidase (family GH31 glycosyl hydrolase)